MVSLRSVLAALGLTGALVFGWGATIASAQQPIGPGQHFIGLVNGSNNDPQVYVVCPGPIRAGRTGPIASGQTMSVANVANGGGYTGPFSQIYAWFVPRRSSATAPTSLTFTEYGVQQSIPTSLKEPCSGRGKVEFNSCPYRAPCAAGWIPDYVSVRFVDIAV